MKLTKQEKLKFVQWDYNVGRLSAMEYVMQMDKYRDCIELQDLFNQLIDYDYFGDGDEYEQELWDKIIAYLELEKVYEKEWD